MILLVFIYLFDFIGFLKEKTEASPGPDLSTMPSLLAVADAQGRVALVLGVEGEDVGARFGGGKGHIVTITIRSCRAKKTGLQGVNRLSKPTQE